MRRKSERNKARSSPEKKTEKTKRGRTSKKRRKSTSSSPERDSPSVEMTQDSNNEVAVETDNGETHSKEVTPEGDEDQVWHVKAAGGSSDTGEIQKLKICLSRPPSISEHSDKSPRARKKLDRSSSQTDSPSESPDDTKKKRHKSKKNSVKDMSDESKEFTHQSVKLNDEFVSSSQEIGIINIADIVGIPPPVTQAPSNESNDADKIVGSVDETVEILVTTQSTEEDISDEPQIEKEHESQEPKPNATNSITKEDIDIIKMPDEVAINHEMDTNSGTGLENSLSQCPTSTVCTNSVADSQESINECDMTSKILNDHNKVNSADITSTNDQTKASGTPELVDNLQERSHTPEQDRSHTPELKDARPLVSEFSRQVSESNSVTQRKRRWGRTSKVTKAPIVNISTDSLKNIISNVQPVGLDDCLLGDNNKKVPSVKDVKLTTNQKKEEKPTRKFDVKPSVEAAKSMSHRKILITTNKEVSITQRPPSPPKNTSSSVLFISNLVRPFTLPQLRNLLQRTGKILENGFWMDKIKSKCYVEYENEDQAVETRHALHGVTWPVSNPKTLNVDFSSHEALQSALNSDDVPVINKVNNAGSIDAWIKDQNAAPINNLLVKDDFTKPWEKRRQTVREWDLGKGEILDERIERTIDKPDRNPERRKRRSAERSPEPGKKFKKKEEEAPAKLLDDLFRKTKTTPCIYWLPLTAEMIKVKEEQRRLHMAEHERRMTELRRARTSHQQSTHHRR